MKLGLLTKFVVVLIYLVTMKELATELVMMVVRQTKAMKMVGIL
jgi:hypothetical protein